MTSEDQWALSFDFDRTDEKNKKATQNEEFEEVNQWDSKIDMTLNSEKLKIIYYACLIDDLYNFFREDQDASKQSEALDKIELLSE